MSSKHCDSFVNKVIFRSVKPWISLMLRFFPMALFWVWFDGCRVRIYWPIHSDAYLATEQWIWMREMTITWTDFYGLYTTSNLSFQIAKQDSKRKWERGLEAKNERRRRKLISRSSCLSLSLSLPSPVLCRLDCHCSWGLNFRIRNNSFQFHISLPAGSRRPRTKPGREAEAPPSPDSFPLSNLFSFAQLGSLCSGNFSVLAGSLFSG